LAVADLHIVLALQSKLTAQAILGTLKARFESLVMFLSNILQQYSSAIFFSDCHTMPSRRDSFPFTLSKADSKAGLEPMGTIQLAKSFTVAEAVSFKRRCQEAFAQFPDLKEVVLDFAETTFIDSSGLGALVIGHKLCEANGARLRLVNVPSQVMMALSLTELDKVFHIEPVVEQIVEQTAASVSARSLPIPFEATPAEIKTALENLPETHPSVRSKAKRAIDIVGALIGLGLTVFLFVVVAIAIKLEDGGPIFFAQTRCSWLGKRFKIWKFRSMVTDAEARKREVANKVEGPLFKNDNDPRITRIGRFLRRTSLDEFPQFWNVLKGDMSLVGTRPPTPDEIEQYEVPQWQRLNVKPGMTGEWQVNGRSTVTTFEEVIQLDLRYQRKWSLWYDIQLIIQTVLVLFSKKSGAM
jgi:anti-anti-sigma factor